MQPASGRPASSERVFFALWPDESLRGALHALARDWHARSGGRVMRRENLHLTLVFVGNVEAGKLAALSGIAARQVVSPFELALDAGAYFKRNRIAFAQPTAPPAALAALVCGLEEALVAGDVAFDVRPHVPHVTLLRDAPRAPPSVIEPPLAWRVDALCLVRSRPAPGGVAYEVVARSRTV